MLGTSMEDELKCRVCSHFFCNPVLLPCSHSVCYTCATNLQEPAQMLLPSASRTGGGGGTATGGGDDHGSDGSSGSSSSIGELADLYPEIDKLSMVSETDSGVVCNSRPNSYISAPGFIGAPSLSNLSIFLSQSGNSSLTLNNGIRCPRCKKPVFLDEAGVDCLPRNRVLENIVEKYSEDKHSATKPKCQLCCESGSQSDSENPEKEASDAAVMCEQCEVFYCDSCRDEYHPARGPLAKHNLVEPGQGKAILRAKNKSRDIKCSEHIDEHLNMFCRLCQIPICSICALDGRHLNHDIQALAAISKQQKGELSTTLQMLSEKAKAGTEFIQRLKSMTDRVQGNCVDFEAGIIEQCDALIEAIHHRKQELLVSIKEQKELKIQAMKEQVQCCTALLQQTTGLLQFSIEVLKESDAVSFLQVSPGLISRVGIAENGFNKEMELAPRVSPEFELTLDNSAALHSISTLNFFEMKAPGQPVIIPEDCSAENNSVTIVWLPYPGSVVEAYTLELDDGNGGDFRVVYVGREMICTVDGLHFNSIYNARVKAHNHCGESVYSNCISLQTAEVAWFTLDQITALPDVIFSNTCLTVTTNSYEPRVALAAVGFSKGVHYWEWIIDRYDSQSDPAFGIARYDVAKDKLLGKDDKAWSMYIDHQRSWFVHVDKHTNRTDGGIKQGSIIGILLDLNKHRLTYYVNDEPHGPIAFRNLHGVFFPAVSLNRNVQVTLRTGIDPPIESETDDDE